MHDINKIRQEPDLFCDGLKKRGLEVDIEKILKIDSNLRESISEIQNFQQFAENLQTSSTFSGDLQLIWYQIFRKFFVSFVFLKFRKYCRIFQNYFCKFWKF